MKLNFIDAVNHSKKNESVWESEYNVGIFMRVELGKIMFHKSGNINNIGLNGYININDIESMWTLVAEKKKTLSDKIIFHQGYNKDKQRTIMNIKNLFPLLLDNAVGEWIKKKENLWLILIGILTLLFITDLVFIDILNIYVSLFMFIIIMVLTWRYTFFIDKMIELKDFLLDALSGWDSQLYQLKDEIDLMFGKTREIFGMLMTEFDAMPKMMKIIISVIVFVLISMVVSFFSDDYRKLISDTVGTVFKAKAIL